MKQEIQKHESKHSALAVMAQRFDVEPAKLLETLKQTVFKNASDAQLMALCIVANEAGLNPFAREIYAFPDKAGGIVPVISIDGWLNRINKHEQFDGMDEEITMGANGKPESATVTIYRKDRGHPTRHTEYFEECHRNTDPWNKSPRRMLLHRATIQCARRAFGFAGADPDEIAHIEKPATGRVVTDAPAIFAGLSQPAAEVPAAAAATLDDQEFAEWGTPEREGGAA